MFYIVIYGRYRGFLHAFRVLFWAVATAAVATAKKILPLHLASSLLCCSPAMWFLLQSPWYDVI